MKNEIKMPPNIWAYEYARGNGMGTWYDKDILGPSHPTQRYIREDIALTNRPNQIPDVGEMVTAHNLQLDEMGKEISRLNYELAKVREQRDGLLDASKACKGMGLTDEVIFRMNEAIAACEKGE